MLRKKMMMQKVKTTRQKRSGLAGKVEVKRREMSGMPQWEDELPPLRSLINGV